MSRPKENAVTAVPAKIANEYIGKCLMTLGMSKTQIPPCGAIDVTPDAMEIPAAVADPSIKLGMTLIGSETAKGMAPSVI